jgi:aryl-alcohol dehydrogenase-like predicted oxidoreductase
VAAQKTFTIASDKKVRRLGYGAMRLTGQPANFGPYADWEGGKELLRHAVDLGVNFIDTARAYGPAWNEQLVADALHPYPPDLVIATKGGVVKKSATERYLDGSPEGLRRDCEESLKNLRIDRIDLYQLHWVDPNTPLTESVSGLAKLREEGKIHHIGLSNIVLDQLKEALQIADIASVQNRFSILEKKDEAIVDFCAARGIAFLPYGPLGGDPFKKGSPLAEAEGAVAKFAAKRNATATQIALTWLLHRSSNIIVIPGTTSIQHLAENIAASDLTLGEEEMRTLSALGPSGTP